jgi:hypothetical protein
LPYDAAKSDKALQVPITPKRNCSFYRANLDTRVSDDHGQLMKWFYGLQLGKQVMRGQNGGNAFRR